MSILQNAQQLRLQSRRHFGHFIDEQGPAFGDLEQPCLGLVGARECALLVAKQFAFEQVLLQGGAVHGDEGMIASRAVAVDGARDQFLAGPARTPDQDSRFSRGHFLDHCHDLPRRRRRTNDSVAGRFEGQYLQALLEANIFHLEPTNAHRPVKDRQDGMQSKRLEDVVERSRFHRLDGGGDCPLAGHDDANQVGVDLQGALEDLNAVHLRHH
ncbi:MAG TPA: hypothetical protein VHR66_18550 [Gemmataceae bacterium]|nr:hypothetical protein [Gemmataceae bacterium]